MDFVDHFWPLGPELLAREELDDHAISAALLERTALEVGGTTLCRMTKSNGGSLRTAPGCLWAAPGPQEHFQHQ